MGFKQCLFRPEVVPFANYFLTLLYHFARYIKETCPCEDNERLV